MSNENDEWDDPALEDGDGSAISGGLVISGFVYIAIAGAFMYLGEVNAALITLGLFTLFVVASVLAIAVAIAVGGGAE